AIPGIGGGAGAAIGAEFKLCETALRETHMFFSSPVGIPIGSTGLFLTGLDGHVTITPVGTEIVVGIDFQAAQGGDGGILRVRGTVTINSQGLFAFQGDGTVLGILDASGKIWVAWNPLDVGFEVELALEDWLRGFARAHMWVGQGFGNKYTWLPDNDERHLTAEWGVTLAIESGDITSFPPLPPFDIEIGFVAAFGQFCTNGSCTSYEWGVKGKFIVVGVDVGLYYGFDEGLDFILGNDGHILIDQYGGTFTATMSASAANAASLIVPETAPAAANGETLIPFTVSGEAEGILAALAWQAGAPVLSLINPDGVEINAGNAAGFQAQVASGTDNGLSFTWFGVQSPKPGAWQAKIANLSDTGIEHYRFWFFANKGAPGAPGAHGAFTKPSQNETAAGVYSIEWSVPSGTSDTATISLYSMRTEVITGNLESGVPIVQNLPFKAGKYEWDTATVRNGSYQIRAVVDDGVNDLAAGQVAIPADACVALTTGLPQPRAFDPNRFPGTVVFTSTATITVNDVTPPASPAGLAVKAGDNALLATWNAGSEKDLSNYLVRWGPRNGNAFQVKNQQLVQASKTPSLRIGAVDNGVEYGVDIFALDVNGNASPASAPVFATPNGLANPEPSRPLSLTVTSSSNASTRFIWSPGPGATPAFYRLTYVKLGRDAATGQVDSNTTEATIAGLQTGAAYDVFVSAANSDGWFSPPSELLRVVITNGADGDGDGLFDDWAAAFGVAGGDNDDDGDGLKNKDEQAAGSNPKVQDSDG
ncbi:MAG TPA: fibronectin type III domain-containing protein, partial [Caldilineaceae bacterium]|nr:fibronectin type III domain-containing protein [Caldilineaceae bacterium]